MSDPRRKLPSVVRRKPDRSPGMFSFDSEQELGSSELGGNSRATTESLGALSDCRIGKPRPAPRQKQLPKVHKSTPGSSAGDEDGSSGAAQEDTVIESSQSKAAPDVKELVQNRISLRAEKKASAKAKPGEEREWWQEPRLETGDQAISFFARMSSNGNPSKFVYLNRAVSKLVEFQPYHLRVAERNKLASEYFTMSAKGVMHFQPQLPSEFIPLSEWMRQSTIFNVLTSVNYFKFNISTKLFKMWLAATRYKRFMASRKELSYRLLLSMQSFCPTISTLQALVHDSSQVCLMNFTCIASKNMEAEEFMNTQTKHRQQCGREQEALEEKIWTLVDQVCMDVTSRARVKDVAPEDEEKEDGDEHLRINEGSRTQSMVATRLKVQAKNAALQEAAKEASMLGRFIRLADYMLVENLLVCVENTLTNFHVELKNNPLHKEGVFSSTIRFSEYEPHDLEFLPDETHVQTLIAQMEEAMIVLVSQVPRVLYKKEFKQYFPQSVKTPLGPHMAQLCRGSTTFRNTVDSINEMLSAAYLESTVKVRIMDEFKHIYEMGSTWDVETFKQTGGQPPDDGDADAPGGEPSLTDFKLKMNEIKQDLISLVKTRVSLVVSFLAINMRTLKETLKNICDRVLDDLKRLVLDISAKKVDALCTDFESRKKELSERSTRASLGEFSNHMKVVNKQKGEEAALMAQNEEVQDLYKLLGEYGSDFVPRKHKNKLSYLTEQYIPDFQTEMEKASDHIDNQMPTMYAKLDKETKVLIETCRNCRDSLMLEPFIDVKADEVVVLGKLDAMGESLVAMQQQAKEFNEHQELYGLPINEFAAMADLKADFEQRNGLWKGLSDFRESKATWMNSNFTDINWEEEEKRVKEMQSKAMQFTRKLKGDQVAVMFKDEVANWMINASAVTELGNPALKQRHWERVFVKCSQVYRADKEFTLADLTEWNIFDDHEFIGEISGTASGEWGLEEALGKIEASWASTDFGTLGHRDSTTVFILCGLDEVYTQLEDDQVLLQTMLASRFVMGVKDMVTEWDAKLRTMAGVLEEWVLCQKSWLYLETIFSADDIKKQLPNEAAKFAKVDEGFKQHMTNTNRHGNCIDVSGKVGLEETFKEWNVLLDQIQKGLEDYLLTKRMAFPRFYFLSNDELISILSQTKDPHAVQPHLIKCFDGMGACKFGEGEEIADIKSMISSEKEIVNFSDNVHAKGNVENWLSDVEAMMRRTLYDNARDAIHKYSEEGRTSWFFDYPAQDVICIDQVKWTSGTEEGLQKMMDGEDKDGLQHFLDFVLTQIQDMVEVVRRDLTKLQRTCMGALITLDVHGREVLKQMVQDDVHLIQDFNWSKQLRYYWDADLDNCIIRQTNTRFLYAYEYLGNNPRLVVTPLTDKCYMTLTGALNVRLGGAPAGPAGTGKTETTKDLAKALARQCVVFNCSDGIDYKMMYGFFCGLAQCGAWACFDEFNRIEVEVLSVIAQQIMCIQKAINNNQTRFDFEGIDMNLNHNYGCFITMNPGYAGRTELPDNLKALFRGVAMMIPDYRMIAEIILFSEGFGDAFPLSNKMTQLYSLSSEQLSKQDHYDFGMRAVKSVLVMAGQLKRANPTVPESLTLIRALRDSNQPKFLYHDLPLFSAIIQDLFPGTTIPDVDYGLLQAAIENQLTVAGNQIVLEFTRKIIQLYETMLVRHGVMLVGATGTGKTTNAQMMAAAISQLKDDGVECTDGGTYEKVDLFILNPKSITMGELYGNFNLLTNEWTDGLIAKLVRDACDDVAHGSCNKKWNIFDGPVDAIWIENMNTVLDDNKMLCLANSERIKLPAGMHMLFEVMDLAVASPATVSRCGMVYMEEVYLGWMPLVKSWLEREKQVETLGEHAIHVKCLVDKHVAAVLQFVRRNCKEPVPTNDHIAITNFLRMFESLLIKSNGFDREVVKPAQFIESINMYFAFTLVWSFGAPLDDSSRQPFGDYVLEHVLELVTFRPGREAQGDEEGDPGDVRWPRGEQDVYGFLVNPETRVFEPWSSIMDQFEYNVDLPFFNILVPTIDTTRVRYIVQTITDGGFNTMVLGETGVGKSVVILNYLAALDPDKYSTTSANFSAQTSAKNLLDLLENKLSSLKRDLLGPPPGKNFILFVDDLNMPALETYGAQPPLELLRQVIDSGGLYDLKKLYWKNVTRLQCVSALGPPGGGRNTFTPRLQRHFAQIWVPLLSIDSQSRIFKSILDGFLQTTWPNDESYHLLSDPIIQSSVAIYTNISSSLLPTPAKCHYTFNLRDLSKVIQGLMQAEEKQIASTEELVNLWCHESMRVFQDRLINEDDKSWFDNQLVEKLSTHLSIEWTPKDFRNTIWGSFCDRDEGKYQHLTNLQKITEQMYEYIDEYNIQNAPMNLVFFEDCILHCARLCRILRQPRGNALLVGVGGSGRQSMTRISAYMNDYKTFQIEIARGYGSNEFHENLKEYLLHAGAGMHKCVFLFSDTQLVNEGFLEDINNILNTGDVPNLLGGDDIAKIQRDLMPECKRLDIIPSLDNIMALYIQMVRENLHIVLVMSPIGDGFRERCRQFPALVNCCTIDWYTEWPEQALFGVAEMFFKDVDVGSDEVKQSCCQLCVRIHQDVIRESHNFEEELRRKNYTTPTSYLELIRAYQSILSDQRNIVMTKIVRYTNGLTKLNDANSVVDELQGQLTKMQPILEQAQKDTAALMITVKKEQAAANIVEEACEKKAVECASTASGAKTIKDEVDKDLNEAMPAYNNAMKALKTLKKSDIDEVRAYKTPPEKVVLCMDAICLMQGKKQSWDESKKLLQAGPEFLKDLETYDKDNIPQATINKLQKYINNADFTPAIIGGVSKACGGLCSWVCAMNTYHYVAKTIAPKRLALAQAEGELAQANGELKVAQDGLAEVKAKVAALEAQYNEAVQKSDQLAADKELTANRLVRAEKLVGGLGKEGDRWKITADQLEEDKVNLVGNVLLACGALAYVGPFTNAYRTKLASSWIKTARSMGIPTAEKYSLQSTLAEPVMVREWGIQGLPSDDFSVENGLLVNKSKRWPLCIDPQSQANKWIKNMERSNNLTIVKLTDNNFLRTISMNIRVGTPVLLENVEEKLDPSLEPILLKKVVKSGGRSLIRIGDEEIDYDWNFRFFITTKLANPHYPPEICIKTTITNFTVTLAGLEDQLLVDICGHERPDLEAQKDELTVAIANDRKELKLLEDKILALLAASEGNILDNQVLIDTLDESGKASKVINERCDKAEIVMEEISVARGSYRDAAKRGSILYFVVADMANIDPMYQYSLEYFKSIYAMVLDKSTPDENVPKRLENINEFGTSTMYEMICRGLFEKDKVLYSFLIAAQIDRGNNVIAGDEWSFFLRGGGPDVGIPDSWRLPNPAPDRIADLAWCNILGMSEALTSCKNIPEHITSYLGDWKEIIESEQCHQKPLPGDYESTLSTFCKLVVIKSLRPEKLLFASQQYVRMSLGQKFTEPPPFDLALAFKDATHRTPIIFVLVSGADPNQYLKKLAEDQGMIDKLSIISLGQGQGPKAAALMASGSKDGSWVCLQNCHLASSWLPELERTLEAMLLQEVNPLYRLWLTSMPSKIFPVSVLQSGIKLTNEPPRGLKANLRGSFNDMQEDMFERVTKVGPWKKLFYGLCFFHAVLQERRKYGAVGFNIPYEFNNSDLSISTRQLEMYLEEQDETPWTTLNVITADVNYGGRVTDKWDQRSCKAILTIYYNEGCLDDDYRYVPDSDFYFPPPAGSLQSYKDWIQSLPLVDPPEAFGLHKNADVTCQQKESRLLLANIIDLQPRTGGGGGGKSQEEIVIETVQDIEHKLSVFKPFTEEDAHELTFRVDVKGSMVALGVFLKQEMSQFNQLVSVLKKSAVDLQRAIKGLVVMSAALDDVFRSAMFNQVPASWAKAAYPSLKPLGSWVRDLMERLEVTGKWLRQGPPDQFWISGFFFPQGFMTGAKQEHSRKTRLPIDTLMFRTEVQEKWMEDVTEGPSDGVFIYGLYMEGARWDHIHGHMAESHDRILFDKVPVIWLDPVDVSFPIPMDCYDCPMYKESTRRGTLSTTGHSTNFVCALQMTSYPGVDPTHWVIRGVAVLCQLDD